MRPLELIFIFFLKRTAKVGFSADIPRDGSGIITDTFTSDWKSVLKKF